MMAASKSFRAILPSVTDEELDRLGLYCRDNFAMSALSRDGPGVVWLCSRDKTRTAIAHRRSARAILSRLRGAPLKLRGAWLTLTTENVVRTAAALPCVDDAEGCDADDEPPRIGEAPGSEDERDVRVVRLSGGLGEVTPSFSFEVLN